LRWGSELAGRLWVALTAITDIILMPALRTAITGLIGLPAEFSLALGPGMDGDARGVGAAGVGAVAGAGAVGATAVAGVMDVVGADMDSLAAAASRTGRLVDSMEQHVVSTALAGFMAEAVSTAEADSMEAADSTVEAVATAVAAVTGKSGIAVLD
jgi:hypothetical protein